MGRRGAVPVAAEARDAGRLARLRRVADEAVGMEYRAAGVGLGC
jgi:hypothetical protein